MLRSAFVVVIGLGMCGCSRPTADNSAIQTPDNQPIGAPKPMGKGDGTMSRGTLTQSAPLAKTKP